MITEKSEHIKVAGHVGTWYVIDEGWYVLTPDTPQGPKDIYFSLCAASVRPSAKRYPMTAAPCKMTPETVLAVLSLPPKARMRPETKAAIAT